jgi:hypothetical protein
MPSPKMNPEDSSAPNSQEPSEVVCPVCLRNNAPEAAFCANCGAPIGQVANIDPIQQIYAEGFAYRSATSGPPRLLVLIGTWLVMLPMAGSGAVMLFTGDGFPMNLFFMALMVLPLAILWRVTAHYITQSRKIRHTPKTSQPDEN